MAWFPAATTRRASVVLLAAAFITISSVSWRQTLALRTELEARQARLAESELQGLVQAWETAVLERVDFWLQNVLASADLDELQGEFREGSSAYSTAFVWEGSQGSVRFVYPPPPVEESIARFLQDPCIAGAVAQAAQDGSPETPAAYLQCGAQDPELALFAHSRAADLWLSRGRPDLALAVLRDRTTPELSLPLAASTTRGFSLYRVTVRRLEVAQALGMLGETEAQELLLRQTGQEILELDGRSLEMLLPFVAYPIRADLQALGARSAVDDLMELERRAQQRLRGYREVKDIAVAPVSRTGTELFHVETGSDPFVLAVSETTAEGLTAAIELDQRGLLTGLARSLRDDLKQHLVVLDATGKLSLAHRSVDLDEPVWVQVPFQRLVPHLRLGVLRSADAGARDRQRWLAAQTVPLAVTVAMGVLALMGMLVADRRLAQVYERQRSFLARVTHELKTPLAGIRVMAEAIELGDVSPRVLEMTERILAEADRLALRIDEILRVARDPRPAAHATVDPAELSAALASTWQDRFANTGGQLVVSTSIQGKLHADRAMLYDAISNLIDNALKYRREDRAPVCFVRMSSQRRWITIDVSDNGLGVPAPHRKAIFEPFVRVEEGARGRAGGHGLGLAFVAETARAHGGTVECRESPEGGARFVLRIRRSP